jgi:hypothetical protein
MMGAVGATGGGPKETPLKFRVTDPPIIIFVFLFLLIY